jgi:hypothetical protein
MRFINNNRIIKLFLFLQKILLPLTDIKNPPNLPVSGMPAARVVPVPYLNVNSYQGKTSFILVRTECTVSAP